MDRGPRAAGAGRAEVVVADDADVRQSEVADELEVALVPIDGARAGEVAEIGQEPRRGL